MNKTKKIVLSVFTLVIVSIGIAIGVLINSSSSSSAAAAQSEQATPNNSVEFTAEAGKTILDQLKAQATVETEDSSYGEYVTSINGNKSDGTKYWTYYVDGQMAQQGAADYVTSGGEKISWRLE